jgi:hypothetical protein
VWRYRRKIDKVKKGNPVLFKPVSPKITKAHLELWGELGIRPVDDWLRYYVNLTGLIDHTFCPEDIFYARIERILVPQNYAGFAYEDKNQLDSFIPSSYRVGTICRWMQGAFFDENYSWLSEKETDALLRENMGDLVVKKCTKTSGGEGVLFFKFSGDRYVSEGRELNTNFLRKLSSSVVVERRLNQDSFSKSFSQQSVNTCRMVTLRCPWNGEVLLLKTMLRYATRDVYVDNMMMGGRGISIDALGRLGSCAYDYAGYRYFNNVLGEKFEGMIHPHYQILKKMVLEVAAKLPYFHLLSFDVVADSYGLPKIIEINTTSQGITQFHGGLFGEHSEQLVSWCKRNVDLDQFSHFRTFY